MNKTPNTIHALALWLSLLFLSGCVTSIDDALPYTSLPEIRLASPVRLVASPAHPTSYLSSEPLPAGDRVQVIGADDDQAWLWVLHDDILGWMPTFFSRTNVAKLQTAYTFEPPADDCFEYSETITDLDAEWNKATTDSATIIGSILRPQTSDKFADSVLTTSLTGPGAATSSDFIHTQITKDIGLILFNFTFDGLNRSSKISFDLSRTGGEDVKFQASFFLNTCVKPYSFLNIGALRSLSTQWPAPSQSTHPGETAAGNQPIIIKHRTGVVTVPLSDLGDTIPWLSLSNEVPTVGYYGFNVDKPPFDNVLVRRAFTSATNRTAIIRAIGSDASPATSFIHPGTLGQDIYGVVGYQFNPSRARALLREAGYPNGAGFPEVTLMYYDRFDNGTIAATASYSWETVLGVKVTLIPIDDWDEYEDTLESDNPYHIFGAGWLADYNDPDNFLFPLFHSLGSNNRTRLASKQIDELLEKAADIEGDPEARQQLYIQAEIAILEDEAAVIPLFHYYIE